MSEIDRVARVLMAAWEEAEGKPVNVSYVATFADMARAVIADRDAAGVEARVRDVLSDIEYERSFGAVLAHQRFGEGFHAGLDYATQRLRAALSGPADEHPADGTGA